MRYRPEVYNRAVVTATMAPRFSVMPRRMLNIPTSTTSSKTINMPLLLIVSRCRTNWAVAESAIRLAMSATLAEGLRARSLSSPQALLSAAHISVGAIASGSMMRDE
jgi:hypothetical protein